MYWQKTSKLEEGQLQQAVSALASLFAQSPHKKKKKKKKKKKNGSWVFIGLFLKVKGGEAFNLIRKETL